MNVKQATKADGSEQGGPTSAPVGDAADVRPIDKYRVRDLEQDTGPRRQVVLENSLDPFEVIKNPAYWRTLASTLFPAGAQLWLTDDRGSYMIELWIRGVQGTLTTGIRGIQFFHRVVWDERDQVLPIEAQATGRWEVRYDGAFHGWRAYRPNGIAVDQRFNDEGAARVYVRDQEQYRRG